MRTITAEPRVWRGNPEICQQLGRPAAAGEKVRKRRLRTLRRLFLLVLFGSLAFKTGQMTRAFIARDPAFRLQRVVVEGTLRHDAAPLRGVLEELAGTSLLEIDAEDLRDRLARFPWVRGFLFRKHYPHTLTVEITERPQLCAVSAGGRVVEVDGLGHVWPALHGVPGVFDATGADVADASFQKLVESLLRCGLSGKVTGVAPGGTGTFLLLTPEGYSLRVSADQDLTAQWERFRRALPALERDFPDRKALDLRWAGRVVLEAGPEAQAGESPAGEAGVAAAVSAGDGA